MKLAARLAIARLRSALNAPREARRRAPLRRAMARRNAGTIKDEGNSVYTFLLTLPHKRAAAIAAQKHKTLNTVVSEALESYIAAEEKKS